MVFIHRLTVLLGPILCCVEFAVRLKLLAAGTLGRRLLDDSITAGVHLFPKEPHTA